MFINGKLIVFLMMYPAQCKRKGTKQAKKTCNCVFWMKKLIRKIDEDRKKRAVPPSRHSWILETIFGKLGGE